MATFVLVHGGWVGGWFWRRVATVLRDAGHYVVTPTLTGCGERKHLGTPQTDLATHITDLANCLEYENVARVVLAGHGYGGMVITGALDRLPHLISHVAYVDAFIPDHGQSLADLRGPAAVAQYKELAAQHDGWSIPLPFKIETMGVTSEVDLRWMMHRFTPQPLQPFLSPLQLQSAEPPTAARSFIHCSAHPPAWVGPMVEKARRAGWPVHEVDTAHYGPALAPREIAALLTAMAPRSTAP
jgi:pimeloyl-ACP methyl ester carboxylesterase